MNEATPRIEVSGLTKRFGKTTALEGLDLDQRARQTCPDHSRQHQLHHRRGRSRQHIQQRPDAVVRAASDADVVET
jgi:hypothetical protein